MCRLLAPTSLIVQQDAFPPLVWVWFFWWAQGGRWCLRSPSFYKPLCYYVRYCFELSFWSIMNWRRDYLLSVEESAGLGFDMAWDFLWEMRCSRSGLMIFLTNRKPCSWKQFSSLMEVVTAASMALDETGCKMTCGLLSREEECKLSTSFLPRFSKYGNKHLFLKHLFTQRSHVTVADEFI